MSARSIMVSPSLLACDFGRLAEEVRAVDAAVANVRAAVLEVAAAAVERLTDEAPAKADIAQAVDRALKAKG